MSITANIHKNDYQVFHRQCFIDANVSLVAKGLFALIMSNDVPLKYADIMDMTTNKRTSIKSAFAELEKAGYVVVDGEDVRVFETPENAKTYVPEVINARDTKKKSVKGAPIVDEDNKDKLDKVWKHMESMIGKPSQRDFFVITNTLKRIDWNADEYIAVWDYARGNKFYSNCITPTAFDSKFFAIKQQYLRDNPIVERDVAKELFEEMQGFDKVTL
jgi:hypothetical protein